MLELRILHFEDLTVGMSGCGARVGIRLRPELPDFLRGVYGAARRSLPTHSTVLR